MCEHKCIFIWKNDGKNDGRIVPQTLEHVGACVSSGPIWVYNIIDLNMGISAPSNAPASNKTVKDKAPIKNKNLK